MKTYELTEAAARVVALLTAKGFTVATAESCTGGLLSASLTAVSGASAVFECGVAAYSAAIKEKVVGVSPETIRKHGTVAAETAAEMADGVRRLAGATLGVGITGSAGPTPAEGHPAGTVFIAVADESRVWEQKLEVDGATLGRDRVRELAALTALQMILQHLE
ncbi:MAG: nicotinamide-nucleotide amidohydrolase family protein [Clostridia bacterium]|nr:nicotinamide-nucleotide amidohydrolase family protein [Clostridia bacterium]